MTIAIPCSLLAARTQKKSAEKAQAEAETTSCPAGQTYHEPGCDAPPELPTFAAGCYQKCTGVDDASCGDGTACTKTSPGAACCGACGGDVWLCLAP